jgi:hypothetical protein
MLFTRAFLYILFQETIENGVGILQETIENSIPMPVEQERQANIFRKA